MSRFKEPLTKEMDILNGERTLEPELEDSGIDRFMIRKRDDLRGTCKFIYIYNLEDRAQGH